MNWTDFIVISIIVLILLAIIFFRFVMPKIKGVSVECHDCPVSKNAKRYLKKYRKQKAKEKTN